MHLSPKIAGIVKGPQRASFPGPKALRNASEAGTRKASRFQRAVRRKSDVHAALAPGSFAFTKCPGTTPWG